MKLFTFYKLIYTYKNKTALEKTCIYLTFTIYTIIICQVDKI